YKDVRSRFVKRDFPQIKQYLWKEMFGSQSYCLLTTGSAPIETIRKYIEPQGK
ncbi:transposase, partial [Alkalihalophilus pseudofirmus]